MVWLLFLSCNSLLITLPILFRTELMLMKKVNFTVFLPMFSFSTVLLTFSGQMSEDVLINWHLLMDDRNKHSTLWHYGMCKHGYWHCCSLKWLLMLGALHLCKTAQQCVPLRADVSLLRISKCNRNRISKFRW